jgi:hypothetical protein
LSPSKEQLWIDVKTFVKFIKLNYDGIPVFLGGHFYLAGLVLNYGTWKDRESVNGYLFISPHFGNEYNQMLNNREYRVKSLNHEKRPWAPAYFKGNSTIIQEEYSEEEHAINPLIVDTISGNVLKACRCNYPTKQFEMLDRPFALWIGEKEDLIKSNITLIKSCSVKHLVNKIYLE